MTLTLIDTVQFLSPWWRDTALQELLARLTLRTIDNSLKTLHLCQGDTRHAMVFSDMTATPGAVPDALQHPGARVVLRPAPDSDNLHSIALPDDEEGACPVDDQLWPRVRELCPLPLLDHWQAPVMTLLPAQQAVLSAQFSQGPFQAWEISLDENDLASRLSGMIRANGLTPEP